jgi:hypothetical protein
VVREIPVKATLVMLQTRLQTMKTTVLLERAILQAERLDRETSRKIALMEAESTDNEARSDERLRRLERELQSLLG